VILSDLRMPGLDGPGLYRAVERYDSTLLPRFVFMTGDTLGHEVRGFLEQSSVVSLSKPFSLNDLLQAVSRVLAAPERG
jgi:two-component system NtrC family sensor kinase